MQIDDKRVIDTLLRIITKYPLAKDEEDAIRDAIGVLSWTKLAESRIKNLRRSFKGRK